MAKKTRIAGNVLIVMRTGDDRLPVSLSVRSDTDELLSQIEGDVGTIVDKDLHWFV